MDSALRIATRLPLDQLWADCGPLESTRQRSLSDEDIAALLRQGPVRFVVADVGQRLRWIAAGESFEFWKAEVKSHMANPDELIDLDNYPSRYAFRASEWSSGGGVPVLVLEKLH